MIDDLLGGLFNVLEVVGELVSDAISEAGSDVAGEFPGDLVDGLDIADGTREQKDEG